MAEQAPPAELIALHASVSERAYILVAPECTLGRDPACTVEVQRPLVSRLHARIVREGLRYTLRDAGSANGTFVNGRLIAAPHPLASNDLIGLGAALSLLHFIDPNATARPDTLLRYDERVLAFSLNGQTLDLSLPQHNLLLLLYRNAGSVCTRQSCGEALWQRPYQHDSDAALDQAITTLRSKLRQLAGERELIRTRRGVGYLLELGALSPE